MTKSNDRAKRPSLYDKDAQGPSTVYSVMEAAKIQTHTPQPRKADQRSRYRLALAACSGLALLGAGAAYWATHTGTDEAAPASVSQATPTATPMPTPALDPKPVPDPATPAAGAVVETVDNGDTANSSATPLPAATVAPVDVANGGATAPASDPTASPLAQLTEQTDAPAPAQHARRHAKAASKVAHAKHAAKGASPARNDGDVDLMEAVLSHMGEAKGAHGR